MTRDSALTKIDMTNLAPRWLERSSSHRPPWSMQAQLRAAQASESLLAKNLARERVLLQQGAIAAASVDDLEAKLQTAVAERQALEHRLRELQNGARRQEID